MMKRLFGFIGARNKSTLTLLVATGLALYLGSTLAYADNIGGHAGHGWPNSAVNCFQAVWAKMINQHCSDKKRLIIPVQLRRDNYTTSITVFAAGNGSSKTTCWGVRNVVGNSAQFTQMVSTTSASGAWLQLGNLPIPCCQGATLAVECDVAPDGWVQMVGFAP